MTNSIFRAIILGIIVGAMFFFMPKLLIGIFILFAIIRLLHFGSMGHGGYGRGNYGYCWHGNCGNDCGRGCECEGGNGGYGRGCGCEGGSGYGHGNECGCYCDCGHDRHHGHDGRRKHHHHDHHDYDHMNGDNLYWVDKIRNMSEEEFTEFKSKREKGYGNWGRNSESYRKCQCGEKSEAECDCDSSSKKEETTNNESLINK